MALNPNNVEIENRVIAQILGSNDEHIIALLLELRDTGSLFLVKPLLEILISHRTEALKRSIVEFLTDIKDHGAVEVFVSFLKEKFQVHHVTEVVTICWQSRLDFSHHIDVFFDILIQSEYQTAFEAFTVIENNIDSLSVEQLAGYIKRVKSNVSKTNRDKQLLLLEMVSMLDKAKRTAS